MVVAIMMPSTEAPLKVQALLDDDGPCCLISNVLEMKYVTMRQ